MLFSKDLYSQVPFKPYDPPSLPSLDKRVFSTAFLHPSRNPPQHKGRLYYDKDNNEGLEFLGDALLYSIVANYVYKQYPSLRVSYLSSIRQRIVQNTTLARFATMYKMDQAIELGEGFEKLRNDTKVRADTFEAFVGAVAEVHGLAVTTKWIEDLIRPYVAQLYEFHATTLGDLALASDTEDEAEPLLPSTSASAGDASRTERASLKRYRLCGFIPLPFLFLWRAPSDDERTKSIAGPSGSVTNSGRDEGYGTISSSASGPAVGSKGVSASASTSATAAGPNKTQQQQKGGKKDAPSHSDGRKPGGSGSKGYYSDGQQQAQQGPKGSSSFPMKRNKSNNNAPGQSHATSGHGTPLSTSVPANAGMNTGGGPEGAADGLKRSKSKERMSLMPTSVANNLGRSNSTPAPASAKAAPPAGPSISTSSNTGVQAGTPAKAGAVGTNGAKAAGKQPEVYRYENGKGTVKVASGWEVPADAVNGNGKDTAGTNGTGNGWTSDGSTASGKKVRLAVDDEQKGSKEPHILPSGKSSASGGARAGSLAPVATAGPSTPAKTILKRDDTRAAGSTPAPAQTSATPSAPAPVSKADSAKAESAYETWLAALQAARTDPIAYLEAHPLFSSSSKGRAKKVLRYDDSLSTPSKSIVKVLVDGTQVGQAAAAKGDEKLAKARAAFKTIETLRLLPDPPAEVNVSASTAPTTPAKAGASNGARTNGTPFAQPMPVFPSTPGTAVAKRHSPAAATPTGPFPLSFYASFPSPGKESPSTVYYITSVRDFSSGTYFAILDSSLRLVGQAHSLKKSSAVSAAEDMAKNNDGKGIDHIIQKWAFEERGLGKMKKVNMPKNAKDSTGPIPTLTHALSVGENDNARLAILEWYSEDKKAWKCVVMVDAIFHGSGKHAERKQAVVLAGQKAIEELETSTTH